MRLVIVITARHTVPGKKTRKTNIKTCVSQGIPYSRSTNREICHPKGSVRDIFQIRNEDIFTLKPQKFGIAKKGIYNSPFLAT